MGAERTPLVQSRNSISQNKGHGVGEVEIIRTVIETSNRQFKYCAEKNKNI